MPDPSAGEVGGIFAGVVALLVAFGKGFAWLFQWDERRREARHAKLERWQQELETREREFERRQEDHHARVEAQLGQVMRQNAALVGAYQLLVAELRVKDPNNPVLGQADELLKAAFPLDPIVPPPLAGLLRDI